MEQSCFVTRFQPLEQTSPGPHEGGGGASPSPRDWVGVKWRALARVAYAADATPESRDTAWAVRSSNAASHGGVTATGSSRSITSSLPLTWNQQSWAERSHTAV